MIIKKKSHSIRLSVIVPFYNISKNSFLRFHNSLINFFRFEDIEIIYVDDGSSLNLYDFIIKHINNFENIHLYRRKINKGPGIARNLGVSKSKGAYILFVDIDDTVTIKSSLKSLSLLNKINSNILLLKKIIRNKTNQGKKTIILSNKKKYIYNFFLKSQDFEIIAILIRRSFLIEKKIRFSNGIYEDIFFKLKLFLINKRKIKKFKFIRYIKEKNLGSITNSRLEKKNIIFKERVWTQIFNYLKLKYPNIINKKDLYDLYMNRVRSELYNNYVLINKTNYRANYKRQMINFLLQYYKSKVHKSFEIKTEKDRLVYKLLTNEI